MWRRVAPVVLALVACGPRSRPAPPPRAPLPASGAPIRHVIVISIDGLVPASYLAPDEHGLQVPTLRALAARGAVSDGARSVFMSLTYPAHATIATGVEPARHRIVSNLAFDPLERNQAGWRWYAEDLGATTLWDAARARGLRTALIDWPVAVGARADAVVPDFWRAGQPDDVKLLRALSTPGLIDAAARRFPDLAARLLARDGKDSAYVDLAIHLIETAPPHLLLLHLEGVDSNQHGDGMWGEAARAAIEQADLQVRRVIDATRAAGIYPHTAFVVLSDHGFVSVARDLKPGVLLRERGLVTVDPAGKPIDWQAAVTTGGGGAYVYLRDPADPMAAERARAAFAGPDGRPVAGVGRIYERDEIAARGGDPAAFLALEAADMYGFAGGYAGKAIGPAHNAATHGFDPERADMRASLLIYGEPIAPGRLEGARLLDVAPTIAGWLGLALPDAQGAPLAVALKAKLSAPPP